MFVNTVILSEGRGEVFKFCVAMVNILVGVDWTHVSEDMDTGGLLSTR